MSNLKFLVVAELKYDFTHVKPTDTKQYGLRNLDISIQIAKRLVPLIMI